MVHGDGDVGTAEHKMPGLVQGVGYSQCFTLNWCVPRFCCMGEAAAHQGDFPAGGTAEEVGGWAVTVLLKQPVADAVLRPVRGQAGRLCLVEDLHSVQDLSDDGFLRAVKCFLEFVVPCEGVGLQK